MDKKGVPVNVNDGFIKSFDARFLERFGLDSLFVRSLSDLWTSAYARMLLSHDKLQHNDLVTLLSDAEAVGILEKLVKNDSLKDPLLQEALGFADPGAIESAFNTTYGTDAFTKWLTAFEQRAFRVCLDITKPPY